MTQTNTAKKHKHWAKKTKCINLCDIDWNYYIYWKYKKNLIINSMTWRKLIHRTDISVAFIWTFWQPCLFVLQLMLLQCYNITWIMFVLDCCNMEIYNSMWQGCRSTQKKELGITAVYENWYLSCISEVESVSSWIFFFLLF